MGLVYFNFISVYSNKPGFGGSGTSFERIFDHPYDNKLLEETGLARLATVPSAHNGP